MTRGVLVLVFVLVLLSLLLSLLLLLLLSKSGAKACVTSAGEMAFVSMQSRTTSRVKVEGQMPALLMRTSRWEWFASTCLTAAAMEVSEVMSSWMREMLEDLMDANAFCPLSRERLPMMQW